MGRPGERTGVDGAAIGFYGEVVRLGRGGGAELEMRCLYVLRCDGGRDETEQGELKLHIADVDVDVKVDGWTGVGEARACIKCLRRRASVCLMSVNSAEMLSSCSDLQETDGCLINTPFTACLLQPYDGPRLINLQIPPTELMTRPASYRE